MANNQELPQEYAFALAVNTARKGLDVISSPSHKVGDIELQLQVNPYQLVGNGQSNSVFILCDWPWSRRAPASMCAAAFNKALSFKVDVTFHHATDTKLNITRTLDVTAPMSSGSCRQGVNMKLAGSGWSPTSCSQGGWASLRAAGWFGSGDYLLVTVSVVGDFDVLSKSGIQLIPDNILEPMWRDMRFADFHIAAKGNDVRCHRSVLAAASPVFQAMLESGMQEDLQTFASIDESSNDIVAMLEFIYTGRLPKNCDCLSILRLLRIADCYSLPNLFQTCMSLLIPKVTADNIADVLKGLSLLDALPGCEVLFALLLQRIQRSFDLVKTIAKHMVQTQLENDAVLQFQPECYNSSKAIAHRDQGIQCNDCDRACDDADDARNHVRPVPSPHTSANSTMAATPNTIPVGPCSSHDMGGTVSLNRSVLLRMRASSIAGDQVNSGGMGISMQEQGEWESPEPRGPRRKTRRGRHNRGESSHVEYASVVTHDSWR